MQTSFVQRLCLASHAFGIVRLGISKVVGAPALRSRRCRRLALLRPAFAPCEGPGLRNSSEELNAVLGPFALVLPRDAHGLLVGDCSRSPGPGCAGGAGARRRGVPVRPGAAAAFVGGVPRATHARWIHGKAGGTASFRTLDTIQKDH